MGQLDELGWWKSKGAVSLEFFVQFLIFNGGFCPRLQLEWLPKIWLSAISFLLTHLTDRNCGLICDVSLWLNFYFLFFYCKNSLLRCLII